MNMGSTLEIFGRGEDLVVIEGIIVEEFCVDLAEARSGIVLVFSCGTLVRCRYDDQDHWRCTVLVAGKATTSESGLHSSGNTGNSNVVEITSENPVTWGVMAAGPRFIKVEW